MIKQSIKYDDYHGNEVTEDFYFNLTKLEIMEMEISFEGGLQKHIEKLTETNSGVEVYHLFKDIIMKSYGKKSDDGRRFIKNEELTTDFEQSPALAELIFGFLSDSQDAAQFIQGILPSKLVAEAAKEAQKNPGTVTELPTAAPTLEGEKKFEDYSREELLEMPIEQFKALVPSKDVDMTKEQLLVAMQRKNQG